MRTNIYADEISEYVSAEVDDAGNEGLRIRLGQHGDITWWYRTTEDYLLLHTMLTNALKALTPPPLGPAAEARHRFDAFSAPFGDDGLT
jgi:hypothetical protein